VTGPNLGCRAAAAAPVVSVVFLLTINVTACHQSRWSTATGGHGKYGIPASHSKSQDIFFQFCYSEAELSAALRDRYFVHPTSLWKLQLSVGGEKKVRNP